MRRGWSGPGLAALLLVGAAGVAKEPTEADLKGAKKIWHTLTPSEQAAYKDLAIELSRRKSGGSGGRAVRTPGDSCDAALNEQGTLPFTDSNTTVGLTDNLNLSDEVLPCSGGGLQFATTGLGPEIVYKFAVQDDCDEHSLRIHMQPTDKGPDADDLALYVILDDPGDKDAPPPCTSLFDRCLRVDDAGDAGDPEDVAFPAVPTFDYYIVVDGFFGDAGPFDLELSDSTAGGCSLTLPVRLQSFTVE